MIVFLLADWMDIDWGIFDDNNVCDDAQQKIYF